jgi:opacity protein-like surface antigen
MAQSRIAAIAFAALWIATTAAAQTRSESRMFTLARSLGTSDARDAELGNGFQVTGTIGRHLTRRMAIEAEVGGGNFEIAQPASSHNLNLLFLSVNLDYGWEWRRWNAFVASGIGAYRYSEKAALVSPQPMKGRDVAPGANIGAGVEYSFAASISMRVQARFHAVSDVVTVRSLRGSFSNVSLGFRRYF